MPHSKKFQSHMTIVNRRMVLLFTLIQFGVTMCTTTRQSLSLDHETSTYAFRFDASGVELSLNPSIAGRVRASTVRTLMTIALAAFAAGAPAHSVEDFQHTVSSAAYWAAMNDVMAASL